MHRITETATTPPAMMRRAPWSRIPAQVIPASNANPKTGVYRNRSAMSNAIGMIQFETGSSVMKKNRMPKLTTGRTFAKATARMMHAATSASPSHASQSRTVASGTELKS